MLDELLAIYVLLLPILEVLPWTDVDNPTLTLLLDTWGCPGRLTYLMLFPSHGFMTQLRHTVEIQMSGTLGIAEQLFAE
ncbi:hypothetical protein EDB19DRAFT_1760170 [Suillus lakei]|nr:hypothetical protein EDB19DRAFT_1760170 [Suillus lakei]